MVLEVLMGIWLSVLIFSVILNISTQLDEAKAKIVRQNNIIVSNINTLETIEVFLKGLCDTCKGRKVIISEKEKNP